MPQTAVILSLYAPMCGNSRARSSTQTRFNGRALYIARSTAASRGGGPRTGLAEPPEKPPAWETRFGSLGSRHSMTQRHSLYIYAGPEVSEVHDELQLLNAEDLAQLLRLSSKHDVYRLARAGQIPGAVRIGRRLRFVVTEIQRWLQGQVQRAANSTGRDNPDSNATPAPR